MSYIHGTPSKPPSYSEQIRARTKAATLRSESESVEFEVCPASLDAIMKCDGDIEPNVRHSMTYTRAPTIAEKRSSIYYGALRVPSKEPQTMPTIPTTPTSARRLRSTTIASMYKLSASPKQPSFATPARVGLLKQTQPTATKDAKLTAKKLNFVEHTLSNHQTVDVKIPPSDSRESPCTVVAQKDDNIHSSSTAHTNSNDNRAASCEQESAEGQQVNEPGSKENMPTHPNRERTREEIIMLMRKNRERRKAIMDELYKLDSEWENLQFELLKYSFTVPK